MNRILLSVTMVSVLLSTGMVFAQIKRPFHIGLVTFPGNPADRRGIYESVDSGGGRGAAGGVGSDLLNASNESERTETPCSPGGTGRGNGVGFGPGDEILRSPCQKAIDRCIGTYYKMDYESCLASRGCKKGGYEYFFSPRCRSIRTSCLAEANSQTIYPSPQSCSVEQACKDLLNATSIEAELAKLSYTMRCVCIQYVQTVRNTKGRSSNACTVDELNQEMKNRFSQCQRPNKN